jgi:hypothetical protein
MIKNFLLSLLVALSLLSCVSTRTISYNILLPSKIGLRADVKTIGLIDRSIPNQETKKADKIDELLSLEGFKLDKKASESCILEMSNDMSRKGFTGISVDSAAFKNTTLNIRPEPLSWDTVQAICEKNKVDLLIVLEYLDTRSTFSYSTAPSTVNVPLGGGQVNTLNFTVIVNTTIETFWRVYDPKTQKVLSENPTTDVVSSTGTGLSLLAAYSAIRNRESLVIDRCQQIAQNYALDIFPRYVRNTESYYFTGSTNMEKAGRMMETRNVEGAINEWKSENSASDKIQGRALYNTAVGYDYLLKSDTALTLARKSYEEYGDKKARNFARELERRDRLIVNY